MMQSGLHIKLTALAAGLVLAGCSMAPTYERPALPVPAQVGVLSPAHTGQASVAELGWQQYFTDARLRALIELALKNNRDLRIAALNIEAARAQYGVQKADRLPSIGATGSMQRARSAEDLRSVGAPAVTTAYTAQLGVTAFELDLFGRVKSLTDAALNTFLATQEARDSAQISLIAQIAQTYIAQLVAKESMEISRKALVSREASYKLTQLRFKSGVISAIDLRNNETLIESAKSDYAAAQRTYEQAGTALALLVGQPLPADLPAASVLGKQMMTEQLPPGVSSEVLFKRPDIRQAEYALQSANANIGAARAAFFPRISLTGAFGSGSTDLDGLFGGGNRLWSFLPSISLPIFDAGRNQANLDLAEVRKNTAVASYEKAIQTAFKEVDDALIARRTWRDQYAAVSASNKADADRLRLVRMRYNNGIASALDLLDAERTSYANNLQLLNVRQAQLNNAIEMYKVLGGGLVETTGQASVAATGDSVRTANPTNK